MNPSNEKQALAIVAEVAAQYNAIAPAFTDSRKNLRWDTVFQELIPRIPHNAHVLDSGCGSGRVYGILQKSGRTDIDYCGIDHSEKLIEIAQTEYPQGKFTVEEMSSLPYPDEKFDCVLAIASLHHIPKSLQNKVMQEWYRILKKSGTCMVTVWNLLTSKAQKIGPQEYAVPWKKGTKIDRYYYGFTQTELEKLFNKNGFKNIQCTEVKNGTKPNGTKKELASNFVCYGTK